MATDALTTIEAERLEACENIIARGLESFVDVGEALRIIRDERLYRLTHATFEDYIQTWGLSRSRAYQLIAWREVDESLSTVVDKPATERQARELAKVEPEQREEVWTAAQVEFDTPQPTANEIKQVREKREKPVEIECEIEDVEQRIFDATAKGIASVWKMDAAFGPAKLSAATRRVLANQRGIIDAVRAYME